MEPCIRLGYVRFTYPNIADCAANQNGITDEKVCKNPGINAEVWRGVLTHFNMCYELIHYDNYGPYSNVTLENTNNQSLVGALIRGQIDATLATMHLRNERPEKLKYSPVIELLRYGFLYGQPKLGAESCLQLQVFSALVFILLFVHFVYLVLCNYITCNRLSTAIWNSYAAVFGHDLAGTNSLLLIGLRFVFIIYSAMLQSYTITGTTAHPPFSTYEELLAGLSPRNTEPGTVLIMEFHSDELDDVSVWQDFAIKQQRLIIIPDEEETVRLLCENSSYVYYGDVASFEYAIGNMDIPAACNLKRIFLNQSTETRYSTFFFRKDFNYSLHTKIYKFINRMYNRDVLTGYYFRKYTKRPMGYQLPGTLNTASSISLKQIWMGFTIFMFGGIPGVSYLIWEIFEHRTKIKTRTRQAARRLSVKAGDFIRRSLDSTAEGDTNHTYNMDNFVRPNPTTTISPDFNNATKNLSEPGKPRSQSQVTFGLTEQIQNTNLRARRHQSVILTNTVLASKKRKSVILPRITLTKADNNNSRV